MVLSARKEYVNAFRTAIEKRTIDLEQEPVNLEDAAVFDFLTRILKGNSDRRILYILNLIENSNNQKLVPYLRDLLERPNNDIKTEVLRMISNFLSDNFVPQVEPLVRDPDFDVRVEAISYIYSRSRNRLATLEQYMQDGPDAIRSAALMVAAREFGRDKELRKNFNLVQQFKPLADQFEKNPDPDLSINAAKIIGAAKDPALYPYLHLLLESKSPDILRSALAAAGEIKADEFIPSLIRHLNTKRVRKQTRMALAAYGERIIDILLARLNDPNENKIIRLSIPKVLALTGSQKAVDQLARKLDEKDLLLRYEVIKALSKLKANFPSLKINKELVTKEIIEETQYYNRTLSALYTNAKRKDSVNDGDVGKARRLLIRALEERLDNNQERIFRLLGLRYSAEDMFNAYRGIVSEKSDVRANAVEFLDNVLDNQLKTYILPILEAHSSDSGYASTTRLMNTETLSESQSLESILMGDDSWLRICALYLVALLKEKEHIPVVRNLTNDSDPLVKETAVFTLRQLGAIA
jgi:AAA family ATP:ADP antiporter